MSHPVRRPPTPFHDREIRTMDDHTLNHVMAAADLLGIPITRQMLEQILYAHAFAVRMIETGRPLDAELTAGFASAPRCELGHVLDGNGLCWTCSAGSAQSARAELEGPATP